MSRASLPPPDREKLKKKRRDARPRAKKYATEALAPSLGFTPETMRLVPATGGSNSLAYILKVDNQPRAVVYLSRRYRNWCDMRDALELGAAHNLPLPRLLHSAGSPINSLRGRFQYLATDFAEGDPLHRSERSAAVVDLMADTLARLHSLQSASWGKPRRLQTGSIREDWRSTIAKRIAGIRSHREAPVDRLIDAVETWFDSQLRDLPEPRSFQMCHHHLAGDDMLLAPDLSRITIIDCGDLQYSRAARDLAAIRETFFPDVHPDWPRFADRYFSHFPRPVRAEWERELPLFTALHYLFKVRSRLGRRRAPEFLTRLAAACGLPHPKAKSPV